MSNDIDKSRLSPSGVPPDYEYNCRQLRIYDTRVLRVSSRLLWRCGRERLQANYDRWVRERHLEVGAGTGYFLDHGRFSVQTPDITLLDVNPGPLQFCAERLARYAPKSVQGDVLEPLPIPSDGIGYGSVGLNYVLHCIAAPPEGKGRIIGNIAAVLAVDGVLFGATVLADGVSHTPLAKMVMRRYQRKSIFHNAEDGIEMLHGALGRYFDHYSIEIRGSVAMFVAQRPTHSTTC